SDGITKSGKFQNRNNILPAYFASCIEGSCGSEGTIATERAIALSKRSGCFGTIQGEFESTSSRTRANRPRVIGNSMKSPSSHMYKIFEWSCQHLISDR